MGSDVATDVAVDHTEIKPLEGDIQPPVPSEGVVESADVPKASTIADEDEDGGDGRVKRKKMAVFMAYVGHGYHGMQRNPKTKTIEGELHDALLKAGAILPEHSNNFSALKWMRAARTDKGVSAVGQVVSVILCQIPDLTQRINEHLPPQIHVLGCQRAVRGFDSRQQCDKRRYEYILPAWVFDPNMAKEQYYYSRVRDESEEAQLRVYREKKTLDDTHMIGGGPTTATQEQGNSRQSMGGGDVQMTVQDVPAAQDTAAVHPTVQDDTAVQERSTDGQHTAEKDSGELSAPPPERGGSTEGVPEEAPVTVEEPFVFDEHQVQKLSDILSHYQGTHTFHNFTLGVGGKEPQAKRYIISFKCTGVIDIQGEPWVRMVVIGQSFMLHQIRKMVGLAVSVMRGVAAVSCIHTAFDVNKNLNTPMAPELGLFLDEAYYTEYNNRHGEVHGALSLSAYQEQVDAFKAQRLYPHIASRDKSENINTLWLKTLNDRNYQFSKWGEIQTNKSGVKERPPAAPQRLDYKAMNGKTGAAVVVGGMESYSAYKRLFPKEKGGQGSKRLKGNGAGSANGGAPGGLADGYYDAAEWSD